MTIVLFLHVAAAIVIIGPLLLATLVFPRYLSAGDVPVMRFLSRTTQIYTLASVAVFLLGLAGVAVDKDYTFGQFWVSSSMTLYVVAVGLLIFLVQPDQRRSVERISAGEKASIKERRIAGVSTAVGIIWLVIVLLMVWRPGS